jgi:hypothetical protein
MGCGITQRQVENADEFPAAQHIATTTGAVEEAGCPSACERPTWTEA